MLTSLQQLILRYKEKFQLITKDTVRLPHKLTGTSIAAGLHKDGIVIVADTQATIAEVGLKTKIETKIIKINDQTIFAIAGVAQFITVIKRYINEFKEIYTDLCKKQPSLKTIINFLRVQHDSLGWNYYSHIILGGYCPIEKKFELYKLASGDFEVIQRDPKKYTVLGSGTKYLLGALGQGFQNYGFKQIEEKLILALKSAVNYDAYSGKDIHAVTLTKQGIHTTVISNLDTF